MKKILLTILAVLTMTGMAMAQTAPSDINLHRNDDGTWSFIMPARNLVMSTETFSTNDTVNGHYLAGVPEGWLILALGDTVPVSNDSLRRTTPITEGTPVTIVPTGDLHRIKSITLIAVVTAPEGAINGQFTVSASGDQVYFSQGNLQATYDGTAWTWAFAANQYDYVGNAAANTSINGNGIVSDNGTVDLFGWVGANSSFTGAAQYGISNSTTNSDYGNTDGESLKSDWGTLAISNSGNAENSGWRTLTSDEWTYLFNTRSASTVGGTENARYAKAKVNDVQGVILFPDTYTHPDGVTAPKGINATGDAGWNGNAYDATAWGKMEAAGCVFLPAAGSRLGSSVNGVSSYGYYGYYWSGTANGTNSAYFVYFGSSSLLPAADDSRYRGYSVRLVRPAEAAGGAASGVTAAFPSLSEATAEDLGMVVCAAGHLHDAKTAVPDGCTAVGILGKVTTTGHGLILALQDATAQTWNTINGWTSVETYAGTTLKLLPDDDARGTNLTSYTTLGETAVSNWAVAQWSDYEAIFTNLGSTTGDSDGMTYDGNVNAYITTGVGGTALSGDYWSATEREEDLALYFDHEFWFGGDRTPGRGVRPVLGF